MELTDFPRVNNKGQYTRAKLEGRHRAKSSSPHELRTDRRHTDRFTLNMNQQGRRHSRRKQGTQRALSFDFVEQRGTIQTARQQTARQAIKNYLEGWVGQVADTTWTNC
uniref:Uncharacterized protein n=1 Tax=Timema bartmani TaxID=61472 RepID=A0A7R9EWZ6_9NEOP|nr:unnamed protein product [Timema bartmani]